MSHPTIRVLNVHGPFGETLPSTGSRASKANRDTLRALTRAGVALLAGSVFVANGAAELRPLEELLGQPAQIVLTKPPMAGILLTQQVVTTLATQGKLSRFSVVERTYASSNRTITITTMERVSAVPAEHIPEHVRAIEVACADWSTNVMAACFALPESLRATPNTVLGKWKRPDSDHEDRDGKRVLCYDQRGQPSVSYRFEFVGGQLARLRISQ